LNSTAAQPFLVNSLQTFQNQTLRLIVHTSIGGTKVRIKISNTYGDGSLLIGGAHVARRTAAAEIDPSCDRALEFHGKFSTTVAAGSMAVSNQELLHFYDRPSQSEKPEQTKCARLEQS
jgi:hypothetical protein